MLAAPSLDLIVNVSDPLRQGLCAEVGGRVMAASHVRFPRVVRNDELPLRIRLVKPSTSGVRAFDDIDPAGAVVLAGFGLADQIPTAGTFRLTTDDDYAESAHNISAAGLQLALNSMPEIGDDGGVAVEKLKPGTYRITWNENGARLAFGAHGGKLEPLSHVIVSRVQQGTANQPEIQLVQLVQIPYAFTNPATAFPAAGATVEQLQNGTADLPSIQRVWFDPQPLGGSAVLTLAGKKFRVPWDCSAPQMQAGAGAAVTVAKVEANGWEFEWNEPGEQPAIEVDAAGLIVPKGVTGVLALNTIAMWHAFAAATADALVLTFEVSVKMPGRSAPQTVLQIPRVTVPREVINVANLRPATVSGFVSAYTHLLGDDTLFIVSNAVTALRGSPTALSAVPTAALALGTMYHFKLPGGALQTWILTAGPADVADLDGTVAPSDYDAATNNKHWRREA